MGSLMVMPQLFLWGLVVLGFVGILIFWKKDKRAVVAGFCLVVCAAGIFRYQMFERPQDQREYYNILKVGRQEASLETSLFLGAIYGFREKLQGVVESSLSPPQSSILGQMMLGATVPLSYELKEKLNRSGTRHITAISGMHVVILAGMLMFVGLLFGLWRGQAFYFALVMIILFIIMVGAPPSAVRAGIMGGIVLAAQKVGRLSQAQRLLVAAAAVMLFLNPLLLKFDVGFQLSFLATLGIAKLSPYFREKLTALPSYFAVRETAAMTLPAIIFTAPLLASSFGQVSLVSVFTNILIIPAISLVLGLGFFAGILGMIIPLLSHIAFWPVWLLLSYAYIVIDWSTKIPYAAVQIEVFPWYMVALYFALLWWGIRYFKLEI